MRAASSLGDRPVQAKCLVCVGDIQRSQNNNEVINRARNDFVLMKIFLDLKVACKKYEAAIQMLQDMNDRSSTTLAMLGLVKTLLALDTQKQMVREKNLSHSSLKYMSRQLSLSEIDRMKMSKLTPSKSPKDYFQINTHLLNNLSISLRE